ncbi:MAG: hypothetical protein K0R98_562 [Rickettsiaceae bacterium]|jgi:hypothetical protein|nr:hypothetical protein [Rickettsiaceae bacterium]
MSSVNYFQGNNFAQAHGENGGVVGNSRNVPGSFAIGNSESRPSVVHGAVHQAQATTPEATFRAGALSGAHGLGAGDGGQYANPSNNDKLHQNKVTPTEARSISPSGALSGNHGIGVGESSAGQLRQNGYTAAYNR